MSIRQLADATGFSKDTLGPFERGARDISFRSKRDLRNSLEDLGIQFSVGESKDEERVELADGWSIRRPHDE